MILLFSFLVCDASVKSFDFSSADVNLSYDSY